MSYDLPQTKKDVLILTLHTEDDGRRGRVALNVARLARVLAGVGARDLLHDQTPVGEQHAVLALLPDDHSLRAAGKGRSRG